LSLCSARGNLTDQQTEEIYSMLRRRPDGRSLGVEHDFVWQVAALVLGSYEMSAAEFEALFRQLAKSARVRSQFPVSRNYAAYLRSSLE